MKSMLKLAGVTMLFLGFGLGLLAGSLFAPQDEYTDTKLRVVGIGFCLFGWALRLAFGTGRSRQKDTVDGKHRV